MKLITLALGCMGIVTAVNIDDEFVKFVKDFKKPYVEGSSEWLKHMTIFNDNLKKIEKHNSEHHSWRMTVNRFTDLSAEDMRSFKGLNKQIAHSRRGGAGLKSYSSQEDQNDLLKDLPESVDWRDAGVVTPVKDQGYCGSCWTFAATECLESHVAIATGSLFTLSEQQFVSCVENPDECGGTGGCSGATMELAYEYAMSNGLYTEWVYPYTSYLGVDGTCVTSPVPGTAAGITNYTKIPTNSYAGLMDAVANQGPISITVDASQWSSYGGGIFTGCNDEEYSDLDHGVLLVGYGTEDGQGYWLVRNSWGPLWGEDGYIRIARSDEEADNCKTDISPSDGVGCTGGPSNVTVCGTCGILYDTSYPTGAFIA